MQSPVNHLNGGHSCSISGIRAMDKQIGTKMSRCVLRSSLDLAYSNRWIAEWLFPTSENATPHPPLKTEAFEQALALHMSHSLTTSDYDDLLKKHMPYQPGEKKLIMHKETDLLVVPVLSAGKTIAGYTFCTGHKYSKMTGYQPVTHASGDFLMSRFVYEYTKRQFLIVSSLPSDGVVGIFQMIFHCDGSCERNFISVPFLHYSADNLPSVIISSQCNLETRDLSTPTSDYQFAEPFPTSNNGIGNSSSTPSTSTATATDTTRSTVNSVPVPEMTQSMDNLLNELDLLPRPFSPSDNVPLDLGAGDPTFDPFSSTPNGRSVIGESFFSMTDDPTPPPPPTRWDFNVDGTTADGVGIPRKPGPSSTSSGAFDMTSMTRALAKLERQVKGSFFCLRAKKDVIDPNTGELLNRQTGQQISNITTMGVQQSTKLRQIAAQTYYATNLSPSVDARLVSPTITSAAQNLILPPSLLTAISRSSTSLPSPTTSVQGNHLITNGHQTASAPIHPSAVRVYTNGYGTTLAPRPVDSAVSNGVVTEKKPLDSAIDKAEAKKIRNRLSAAKSNQRRRAQLEAQRKQLATLQQRVVELRKKKELMTAENGRLRVELYGDLA